MQSWQRYHPGLGEHKRQSLPGHRLRNVFGLKDPPPPPPPPEPPKPPVNIVLTGITTLGGQKRAFMTITTPPKPGAPAVPTSLILLEKQAQEGIEVLEINEKDGTVKVNQNGSPI